MNWDRNLLFQFCACSFSFSASWEMLL